MRAEEPHFKTNISAAALKQKETSWLSEKTLKSLQFIYVALQTCLVIVVSKKWEGDSMT